MKLGEGVMDEKEKLRLKEAYSEMPDNEIIEMLLVDQSEYEKDVYDLLLAEAQKRGLETKINEMREKRRLELPFAWGKFVIFMDFFQGSIAFIFGGIFGIKTEYFPNRIYSIILGSILLSCAYGLMKRKRWGLNILLIFLYVALPLCVLLFISGIAEGSIESIIQGIGRGIITFLNIIYFRKRKIMFE